MVKKHRQICFSLLFCFNQISGHFCFILKGKSWVILGRVPEIYTNIHQLYGLCDGCIGQYGVIFGSHIFLLIYCTFYFLIFQAAIL